MNTVIVSGNLGHDAQLRITPSGRAVCDVSLAVREWRQLENQETMFVRLAIWGPRGEALQPYLKKGTPLVVQGRLALNRWETSQGEPRSQILVTVSNLQFLGKKPEQASDLDETSESEPPEEINVATKAENDSGDDESKLVASGNGSRKRKK